MYLDVSVYINMINNLHVYSDSESVKFPNIDTIRIRE